MIQAETRTGFKCEIADAKLDNMELLDAIADLENNPLGVTKVLRMLLSDDQRQELYDHLRTKDGNVPVRAVSDAVVDILNSNKQGKN